MNTLRKALISAGLVGTTVVGGAVGAALVNGTANAATSPSSASSSSPGSSAPSSPPPSERPAFFPPHGTPEHEGQEKPVTGAAATQAQAAAVKSVGGGTAVAVTTDMTGKGYEVTVTKPDGSQIEVHLDSSFNVMQGGGHHGPGRPDDNDADDQPATSTTTG
jgi:hypothetical protein